MKLKKGNFPAIARQLLRELPLQPHKRSYTAKKYGPAPSPQDMLRRPMPIAIRPCRLTSPRRSLSLSLLYLSASAAWSFITSSMSTASSLCMDHQPRHGPHTRLTAHPRFRCMADADSGNRVPFMYLDDIATKFKTQFGRTYQSARESGLDDVFGRTLRDQLVRFPSPRRS